MIGSLWEMGEECAFNKKEGESGCRLRVYLQLLLVQEILKSASPGSTGNGVREMTQGKAQNWTTK